MKTRKDNYENNPIRMIDSVTMTLCLSVLLVSLFHSFAKHRCSHYSEVLSSIYLNNNNNEYKTNSYRINKLLFGCLLRPSVNCNFKYV